MKTKFLRQGAALAFFALLFCFVYSPAQPFSGRVAAEGEDGPPAQKQKVVVAALYPSLGTVKDLETLRKYALIDLPDFEVLGVYHEKEKTDYEESKAFVTENGLDWITFHPISAPISAETVFQKNGCTPEFEKIMARVDGIIFFGGPDIPPYLYKEKTSLLTEIDDPARHFMEVSFVFHLLGGSQDDAFKPLLEGRPDFPVLGICLGCQSLNVGTGGTLTQDIWSEVFGAATVEDAIALGPSCWHSNPYAQLFPQERFSGFTFHEIRFSEGGRFQQEIGWDRKEQPFIFSSHHQQAERLGKGFRVIASSLDGKVVEAIEHERYRHVLGVQFHPEAWVLFNPDYQTRFTPEDKEPFGLKAYLEGRPASLAFHKKLWAWVTRAWAETHHAGAR
jgi:putative glutamine amidotransferase